MSARHALALLLLVACSRPRPDAVVDAGAGAMTLPPPTPVAQARDEPPIPLALDGGFAALLDGTASAARLPEVASDFDYDFDRTLRDQLTTVTRGNGLGSIGQSVNDEPAIVRRRRPEPPLR